MMKKILFLAIACSISINSFALTPKNSQQLATLPVHPGSASEQTCSPEWGKFIFADINKKEQRVRCVYEGSLPGYAIGGNFSPASSNWETDADGNSFCTESATACKFKLSTR